MGRIKIVSSFDVDHKWYIIIRHQAPCSMRSLLLLLLFIALSVVPSRAAFDVDVPEQQEESKPENEVVDLNLASSLECVPASLIIKSKKSYLVTEGKSQKIVTRRSMLTAAEYFTVKELIEGRSQPVALCTKGTALSGTFILDKELMKICRSLLVPQGVQVIQDITQLPKVDLEGELKVNGTYLIVGQKNCDAYIKARWIKLQPGSYLGTCSTTTAPVRVHLTGEEELEAAGKLESTEELDLSSKKLSWRPKADKHANRLRTSDLNQTQNTVVDVLSGDVSQAQPSSAYQVRDVIESFLPINDQEELIAPHGNDAPVDSTLQQKERKT